MEYKKLHKDIEKIFTVSSTNEQIITTLQRLFLGKLKYEILEGCMESCEPKLFMDLNGSSIMVENDAIITKVLKNNELESITIHSVDIIKIDRFGIFRKGEWSQLNEIIFE